MAGMKPPTVDVHQHLWGPELVAALRRRARPPRLDRWTLHLTNEPPSELDPAQHDPAARLELEPEDRTVIGLSLSAPLGLEYLPPAEAEPLLQAWHADCAQLPAPYRPWASVGLVEPDLVAAKRLLGEDVLGLQVPANALATPAALERLAPLLAVCEEADRPLLVHPGPAGAAGPTAAQGQPGMLGPAGAPGPAGALDGRSSGGARDAATAGDLPAWWVPVVDYPAQLQAAWWSWHVAGRALLPRLRVCFVAGAGLAPVHHERLAARGGGVRRIDPDVFVEISSYGRQGVDALVRALGIDVVVLGSDRPWAAPPNLGALGLGEAGVRAVTSTNPTRLLEGGRP